MPIDHIGLGVPDLDAAIAYYDELMPLVGFVRQWETGYRPTDWSGPQIFLYPTLDDGDYSRHRVGLQHISFHVPTRADVHRVHEWAKERGHDIVHPPTRFPEYHEHFYATFFVDVHGFMLEAVTYEPASDSEVAVAAGYDRVYAAMPNSPTLQEIWRPRAGGPDFPSELGTISFLTVAELQRFAVDLAVGPDDVLVDLACGAGGPGLWVARATSSRLIGIDIAVEGITAARSRAAALGLDHAASFRVGSFAATGLDDATADGAMTVDALQYAPDKAAALAEVARILRSGGRFVFAAFEVDPERAAGVPVFGDDPVPDYRPLLEAAGFTVEAYDESTGWRERLTSAYGAVLAAESALTDELGEAAYGSLALEMSLTLELEPYRRRVIAVATRR